TGPPVAVPVFTFVLCFCLFFLPELDTSDLPGCCFWQFFHKFDLPRIFIWCSQFFDMILQFFYQIRITAVDPFFYDDECFYNTSSDLVRTCDYSTLLDRWMFDQCILHFK